MVDTSDLRGGHLRAATQKSKWIVRHITIASVVTFAGFMTFGIVEYHYARDEMVGRIGDKAMSIALLLASEVEKDIDEYLLLQTPADVERPVFKRLHALFLRTKQTLGLRFVYTENLSEDKTHIIYGIDGEPLDSKDYSPIGEKEYNVNAFTREAYAKQHPTYGPLLPYERWGMLLTGYAPIRDRGGVFRGFVGVDVDATRVAADLARLKRNSIILAVSAAAVIAGALSAILRLVTRLQAREQAALRAEAALRESEASYRELFNSVTDAIYVLDVTGALLDVNETSVRTHGRSRAAMLGSPLTMLVDPGRTPPAEMLTSIKKAFDGEPQMVEWWSIGDGGRTLPQEVVLARSRYFGREVVIGLARDISDRKQAEAALRQREAEIRQAQRMEAVGRLAGGVAHEFNNLLTVIIGHSELLRTRHSAGHPSAEDAEDIHRAAERAAALIRQLLAFSRRQVLQPKVLDLNGVVASMEAMLAPLLREHIELVTVPDSALWPVMADPGQLEQVIFNLAVHALDAMPRGGRLTVRTANVELTEARSCVDAEMHPGRYVTLVISDTGVGIDAETRAHLFEPFFTTRGPGTGTGLDLPTVYGIVKQSGGDIEVHSEVGCGTTFTVYLPAVEPAAPTPEPHPTPLSPRHGSETVLLVEDEEGIRSLAREVLEMYGYTVLEARHGVEALAVSAREAGPIHLLLTDVVMPQMNGPDVADRLTRTRPELRVLYMSGYADTIIHHGVSTPGTAFLPKPFSPHALARKVREVLEAPRDDEPVP